jgi:hypothetical protein
MSKRNEGLIKEGKFHVSRIDGNEGPGTKHDGCFYFVLDVTHDSIAREALNAYADMCQKDYPLLAADLREQVNKARRPHD